MAILKNCILLVTICFSSISFAEEPLYCLGCHPHKAEKGYVHKPVKDGECISCHKSTGKQHPKVKKGAFTQTDNGKSGLCTECHEPKNNQKFVHAPVASGDCLDCHDVHQSDHKYQLKASGSDLCFLCHDKSKIDRKYPHKPIVEGKCSSCHDPHQSNVKFMLKGEGSQLCFRCHEQKKFTGVVVHKPVAEAKCGSCHSTHGTENPHLLNKFFPEEFYMPFNKDNFSLCFGCHKDTLADEQFSETTGFRNGIKNLHFVHVNKNDKGRSCKTCHDPHAANQGHLISSRVPHFGAWRIPIRYTQTNSGGTCVAGCHKPKSYDRNQAITNQ